MIDKTEKHYCKFYALPASIYTLSDKKGNVFYVGCTYQRLEKRLAAHIAEARTKTIPLTPKNQKIRDLKFKISISTVDHKWFTGEHIAEGRKTAMMLEKQWIKKYEDLGFELTNCRTERQSDIKYSSDKIGKTLVAAPGKNRRGKDVILVKEIKQTA